MNKVHHEKFQFIASDGLELCGQYWCPDEEPAIILCLQHGLAEHSGRYEHVARYFCEKEVGFFASDLRGHGKSEGKRGHAPSIHQLLDDAEDLLKQARKRYLDAKLVLYGHSTGGNIVANYLIRKNVTEVSAAIITSPWLRLAFKPPKFKIHLAKFVSKIYPSFSQDNELNPKQLSRDEDVVKAYVDDPLVHHQISAGLFFECYKGGEYAIEKSSSITRKALIMHGTEDRITSAEASEEFAKANELLRFKIWDGLRHELHNEPEKLKVLEEMNFFLKEALS